PLHPLLQARLRGGCVSHQGDSGTPVGESMQTACTACTLHADVFPAQEDPGLLRTDVLHDHHAALHERPVQKVVVGRLAAILSAIGHLVLRPAVSPLQMSVAEVTELPLLDFLQPLLRRQFLEGVALPGGVLLSALLEHHAVLGPLGVGVPVLRRREAHL
ncbi:MAG: hypothetical protein ACK56I_22530, partial [bacterium]